MATPEFFGTDGPDVVSEALLRGAAKDEWSHYFGLGGDDQITWWSGQVIGGPGNDTIARDAAAGGSHVYAAYWDSPAGIVVDLAAGYALDGHGGTDTLIRIDQVGDGGHDDRIYGNANDNWLGVSHGDDFVDGRGGFDTISTEGPISAWHIEVSSDLRTVVMSRIDGAHGWGTDTLVDVEAITFWNESGQYLFADLVDFSRVGPDTLIGSPNHGWSPGQPGQPAALTYSFMSATPAYGSGGGGSGFTALSPTQQQTVRDILARLSTEVGLTFTEVADGALGWGQLRFGINQQAATKAYSFVPGAVAGDLAGDVWIDVETAQLLAPGQEGYQALLHEIGHALGLGHPLPESDTSGRVVLVDAWNDTRLTVMSEREPGSLGFRDWFGVFDVDALRGLYGARAANPGDDTYAFDDAVGLSRTTIVDDGGWNRIDISATSAGATLDLRAGSLSSAGRSADGFAASGNLALAHGTLIREAIGSPFDDLIVGNAADNLIAPGDGNDRIDAGAGLDTVRYDGDLADYAVTRSLLTGSWLLEARDGESGSDTLDGVERLRFDDGSLALDLDGSPGATAKLIGAVFGPDFLSEQVYVGIGIALFDDGMTMQQVADLAIQTGVFVSLAGSTSNADFVRVVYENVIGEALTDPAMLGYFVGLLEAGLSKSALAVIAAEHESNLARIDLAGLATTGLPYLEWAP